MFAELFFNYVLEHVIIHAKVVDNEAKSAIVQIRIVNHADDCEQALKCKWPDEHAFKSLRDVKPLKD